MYLIAEVGLAHDGSLGAAQAYLKAAAKTGIDAVKFQTHIPSQESSPYEDFRVKTFPQDRTRYEYWQRTSFTKNQWLDLARLTSDLGIDFLSSPFSLMALEWLLECDVPAWKVASGEVTNFPLLKQMAATGKPILLSSGMSSWAELDKSVEYLRNQGGKISVFQCTTSYPCPPEQWGLNIITELMNRYGCPVGLSDHSGTIFPTIAARILGATLAEFHVTFHSSQFGPDTSASLTFDQVTELVEAIRQIETALTHPVDKDYQAESLSQTRVLFSKSLYAAHDLEAGQILKASNLLICKPAIGIPAAQYEATIGRVLAQSINRNQPILPEHIRP